METLCSLSHIRPVTPQFRAIVYKADHSQPPFSSTKIYTLMIILSILSSTKFQCCYFNNPERNHSFQKDDCSSGDNYQCLPPKLRVYHLHACCQHPAKIEIKWIVMPTAQDSRMTNALYEKQRNFKGMQKLWTSVIYANCNVASSTCSF